VTCWPKTQKLNAFEEKLPNTELEATINKIITTYTAAIADTRAKISHGI
jgi:hypothetical protein